MNDSSVHTSIRLRSDLAHRLDERAAADGRTRSNMVARLVDEGLRRREAEDNEEDR